MSRKKIAPPVVDKSREEIAVCFSGFPHIPFGGNSVKGRKKPEKLSLKKDPLKKLIGLMIETLKNDERITLIEDSDGDLLINDCSLEEQAAVDFLQEYARVKLNQKITVVDMKKLIDLLKGIILFQKESIDFL